MLVRGKLEVPVGRRELKPALERGVEPHGRGGVRGPCGEREGAVRGLLGEGEVESTVPRGSGDGEGATGMEGGGVAQRDLGVDEAAG